MVSDWFVQCNNSKWETWNNTTQLLKTFFWWLSCNYNHITTVAACNFICSTFQGEVLSKEKSDRTWLDDGKKSQVRLAFTA